MNSKIEVEPNTLFVVDDLLRNLINKIEDDLLSPDIQEFIDKLKQSQNFKSDSDLYFDLKRLDQNLDINAYLKVINENMSSQSKKYYLGLVKTVDDLKKSSPFLKIPLLKYLFIFHLFIFRRFLPKIFFLNNISFLRAIRIYSQAEIMGRLHYSGFKILQFEKLENNLHFFLVKKESIPRIQKIQEGLFISLIRIGQNGKRFKVFKIRTMHPYSEFIHEYLIEQNGFDGKGKIKNDFRTSGWGKFLRKTWLDELPQLINVLKGNMKIFGVRPVSESYFKTLPIEFQAIRLQQKPGCIPPYLVFSNGTTKDQVVEAEKIYLKKCIENKTFWIDLKYTLLAINKIILKGKRSS